MARDSVVIHIDGDDSGFKKALSGIGNVAKVAAKGVAVAASGIAALGTAAIKSYADFEQLAGGVETLFGAKGAASVEEYAATVGQSVAEVQAEYDSLMQSQNTVMQNAASAYKTAGLSANEYMETVTSFSASLKQSFEDTPEGIQAAADAADIAVTDMADNANKMGTSMEAIQNAYQGFAKQNYTMLDNLKLGYGGTKTEMERLLADAQKLSGVKYDINNLADVYSAIHVIQTELGITGTTALEASTTISGSANMMKAAWSNLMTGLADDNANFDVLLNNFLESVLVFGDNIIPRIQTTLEGIGTFITGAAATLIPKVVEVIISTLPSLLSAAVQLVSAFGNAIIQNLPLLLDSAMQIIMQLVTGILQALPQLYDSAYQIIAQLANGIAQNLPVLVQAAIEANLQFVDSLLSNIDLIIDAGIQLIIGLADGLIMALPDLIERIPEIIGKLLDAITTNAPKLIEAGGVLIGKLIVGILAALPNLIQSTVELVAKVASTLNEWFTQTVPEAGKNLVAGIWQGISSSWNWLVGKIKEWCGNILDNIKSFFGIHSPSRVMRDQVGKMITQGIAVGIDDGKTEVQKVLDEMNEELLESEQKYLDESERLKDSKSDADKKYLEELKDAADAERKIYDALRKDIENSKQAIVDDFTEMTDEAFAAMEDIESAQKRIADNLNEDTTYSTYTLFENGEEKQYHVLGDGGKRKKELEDYSKLIDKLFEKYGEVPDLILDYLSGMDIEEGTIYINELLEATDEQFEQYIGNEQGEAYYLDKVSKQLTSNQTEELAARLEEEFGKVPEDFFNIGEESAEMYGEGFIAQLKNMFAEVQAMMSSEMAVIGGQLALAGAGNITSTSYTDARTTTINVTSDETGHLVYARQKAHEIYEEHTRKVGG